MKEANIISNSGNMASGGALINECNDLVFDCSYICDLLFSSNFSSLSPHNFTAEFYDEKNAISTTTTKDEEKKEELAILHNGISFVKRKEEEEGESRRRSNSESSPFKICCSLLSDKNGKAGTSFSPPMRDRREREEEREKEREEEREGERNEERTQEREEREEERNEERKAREKKAREREENGNESHCSSTDVGAFTMKATIISAPRKRQNDDVHYNEQEV